jgi:hypothetical protein
MWLTIAIAVVLFAGMFAVLWFGYQQAEEQRRERPRVSLEGAQAARPGHCILCDAPLRRTASTDEVVFEIEHRIDTELKDIGHVLRTQPGSFQRLYRA